MKRLAGILGIIGALGAASFLFYVKHEVGVPGRLDTHHGYFQHAVRAHG